MASYGRGAQLWSELFLAYKRLPMKSDTSKKKFSGFKKRKRTGAIKSNKKSKLSKPKTFKKKSRKQNRRKKHGK